MNYSVILHLNCSNTVVSPSVSLLLQVPAQTAGVKAACGAAPSGSGGAPACALGKPRAATGSASKKTVPC